MSILEREDGYLTNQGILGCAGTVGLRDLKSPKAMVSPYLYLGYVAETARNKPTITFMTIGWPPEDDLPFFLKPERDALMIQKMMVERRLSGLPELAAVGHQELERAFTALQVAYQDPETRWVETFSSVFLRHLDASCHSCGSFLAVAGLFLGARGVSDIPVKPDTLARCEPYWLNYGVLRVEDSRVSVAEALQLEFNRIMGELVRTGEMAKLVKHQARGSTAEKVWEFLMAYVELADKTPAPAPSLAHPLFQKDPVRAAVA